MFKKAREQFGEKYYDQIDLQFPDAVEDDGDFSNGKITSAEDHHQVKFMAKHFNVIFDKRESDLDKKQIFEEPDTVDQDFIVDDKKKKRKKTEAQNEKEKKAKHKYVVAK